VLPFEDSRRLTGGNLFFASTGAVLEVVRVPVDSTLIAAWRDRVRPHAGGTSLALGAPSDQLFLATEVNEWALCASLVERDANRWSDLEGLLVTEALQAAESHDDAAAQSPPVIEEVAAFARFALLAAHEARPKLRALLDAAATRDLPYVLDESELTVGAGVGGRTFALTALPDAADVPWDALHAVPTAIVTGSNGKTTTVRLLAACARLHGWRTGYNCTDGVFLDDEALVRGDYSGPAGAQIVMREPRTQAAILEVARGGILRRGIAVTHACAAVVTNVTADHFGEYGIDDLAGLADVKLTVAGALRPSGLLALNADDVQLREQARHLEGRFGRVVRVGWFSAQPDDRALLPYRARGASTCGVRDGKLNVHHEGANHDLGFIAAMPLSMAGTAAYNIANLAGAALAAISLGITPATIARVVATFGSNSTDNPGRLMRFTRDGVTVLIDYAHNPDGLRGFLNVANHLRGSGRLGLILGQAGNRKDADIEELARVAAGFRPDLIVVKENENQLRGRAPGEVPRIIRSELKRLGVADAALTLANNELDAARYALQWARSGDLLALPIHSSSARDSVVSMLVPKSGG
jgi:cyanophycin synthetase